MPSRDPFRPLVGDEIGPTRVQRARSGATLVVVLLGLGLLAGLAIGLAVLLLWAAFTAALG